MSQPTPPPRMARTARISVHWETNHTDDGIITGIFSRTMSRGAVNEAEGDPIPIASKSTDIGVDPVEQSLTFFFKRTLTRARAKITWEQATYDDFVEVARTSHELIINPSDQEDELTLAFIPPPEPASTPGFAFTEIENLTIIGHGDF
jgi:hypothetical protein